MSAAFTAESLHLQQDGPVATLTIMTPKSTLGPSFWRELPSVLAEVAQTSRVVVLRGYELMSAGLDLKNTPFAEMADETRMREIIGQMQQAIESVAQLRLPVVAAIHGPCVGAGVELAAACDVRLCSAEATFSLPEIKLGIVADLGALQRLPRLIGLGRTAHMALTAQPIGAATAEQWGLVSGVYDSPEQLFAAAQQLAQHLAQFSPHALAGTKQVLQDSLSGVAHQQSLAQAADWNVRGKDQLLHTVAALASSAKAVKPAAEPKASKA